MAQTEEIQELEETQDDDVNAEAQTGGEDDASATDETTNDEVDELGGATDDELALARANGWSGRANWKGDPAKFKTAKDFAAQSAGINVVLKRELAARDKRHAEELAQVRKDVAEFQEMTRKAAERELNEKVTAIRAKRVQALNDGDGAAFDAAERELDELRRNAAPAPKKPAAETPPNAEEQRAAIDFKSRNTWFETDKRKTNLALAVAQEIRDDSPHLIGKPEQFLPELETRLKRDYPEVFGQKRMTTARTEGGEPSRQAARTTKRTFEQLPKDAQAACDRLIKQGIVKKREDYVKNFDWETA